MPPTSDPGIQYACSRSSLTKRLLCGRVCVRLEVQSIPALTTTWALATAVLAAARGLRNEARWTVALALGLRQFEALALQWRDIDLLNGPLTVRALFTE